MTLSAANAHEIVPRDFEGNVAFRKEIFKYTANNEDHQREIRILCAKNPAFYVNTFVYGTDSRQSTRGLDKMPFIMWPKQEEAFNTIWENLGMKDMRIVKSRCQGGSYIVLIAFHYACCFRTNVAFIVSSWRQDYIDDANNPKALLPKIDSIHAWLPKWLVAPMRSRMLTRFFPDTQSMVSGETGGPNLARAARPTAVLMDEGPFWEPQSKAYSGWAAATHSTACRISLGTVNGPATLHADLKNAPSVVQIVMDWKDNPTHARGMYRAFEDRVEHLDPNFILPEAYPFIRDGKKRSPWYDDSCRRAEQEGKGPEYVARELDMDEEASQENYFYIDVLRSHAELFGRTPSAKGFFHYDPDTREPVYPLRFIENPKGWIHLWGEYDRDKDGYIVPPAGLRWAKAADVGAGTGASNSVIVAGEIDTGRKRLQMVSCDMNEMLFAKWGLAICRWCHNAMAAWDGFGPCGQNYGKVFVKAQYPHIHYNVTEKRGVGEMPTGSPGVFMQNELRMLILGMYRDALGRAVYAEGPQPGAFINPCKDALLDENECPAFIYDKDGKVIHVKANKVDKSGAKSNHGDRMTADAILNYIFDKYRQGTIEIPTVPDLPQYSFAALVRDDLLKGEETDLDRAIARYDNWNGSKKPANIASPYDNWNAKWRGRATA